MAQQFVFVGGSGVISKEVEDALKSSGLPLIRLSESYARDEDLSHISPAAMLFGDDIADLGELITSLREKPNLASTPMLACVSQIDNRLLSKAFRAGLDDYILEGFQDHLEAVVATLKREDPWRSVRAPLGNVILAHQDRTERIRLSRVLQRNGFDIHFAGSTGELTQAMGRVTARAMIVSIDLPGKPVINMVKEQKGKDASSPPWIIVASAKKIEKLSGLIPQKPRIAFFEIGTEAEGITMLMNDLLSAASSQARKSPRLLYGTPVSIVHTNAEVVYYGFTFNINLDGLYIRTLTPLPVNTQIDVSFKPPFVTDKVIATSNVVWSKRFGQSEGPPSPPGMGVQFVEMRQPDRSTMETGYKKLLKKLVEKKKKQGGAVKVRVRK